MVLQRRTLTSALAVSLLLGLCVAACSGDGEGGRCDIKDDSQNPAGTSDCASGLVCTPPSQLSGQASSWTTGNGNDNTLGVCCPAIRANATTSVCALGGAGLDASVPTKVDGGSGAVDGGAADAPADVVIDVNDAGPGTDATPDSPAAD
jgi:hypothetical protein